MKKNQKLKPLSENNPLQNRVIIIKTLNLTKLKQKKWAQQEEGSTIHKILLQELLTKQRLRTKDKVLINKILLSLRIIQAKLID